jgi:hypothetical protein
MFEIADEGATSLRECQGESKYIPLKTEISSGLESECVRTWKETTPIVTMQSHSWLRAFLRRRRPE